MDSLDLFPPCDYPPLTLISAIIYLSCFDLGEPLRFSCRLKCIRVWFKPRRRVFSALLAHSPWLSLASGCGSANPEQAVGVVSLQLASQLAHAAGRRRAAPSLKNSLSPNVAARWSEPCAPLASLCRYREWIQSTIPVLIPGWLTL